MTRFVLSHNLQIQDSAVPPLAFDALAKALAEQCNSVTASEALSHPHWKISLESTATPGQLAQEISQAWRKIRADQGHSTDHAVMALGGRKDSEGTPGAPLQQGGWGVDVVETRDPDGFLQAINWIGLTAGRPADGIFQLIDRPG
ncbi:DUF2656 family protein [Synechococcus sp. N5]|uniref:DUF2656 family protein n=1 Tax=Synechococcus sp. N5 TaxID=2575515 RepID=UPI000E0F976E|nr:DUF2656 family protein [Synechococcus sp. N5]